MVAERYERRAAVQDFKRKAILAAARAVFARKGATGLTIRAVATEAGYATGAVYTYFDNKEDLLAALVSDELAALAKRLRSRDAPLTKADAAARLAAIGQEAFEALTGERGLLPLVSETFEGELSGETERLLNGRLIGALGALGVPLELEAVDPAQRAQLTMALAAFLLGAAMLERSGRFRGLGLDGDRIVQLGVERLAGAA
ncbi:MAG: TetR family transcriptional regulator [Alphaproteobacteria bacterium]|nr:TetR family transcriptional regulator [Alphaproteobacteria bacterium]